MTAAPVKAPEETSGALVYGYRAGRRHSAKPSFQAGEQGPGGGVRKGASPGAVKRSSPRQALADRQTESVPPDCLCREAAEGPGPFGDRDRVLYENQMKDDASFRAELPQKGSSSLPAGRRPSGGVCLFGTIHPWKYMKAFHQIFL